MQILVNFNLLVKEMAPEAKIYSHAPEINILVYKL